MTVNKNTIDLHVHSDYSDGSMAPAEIVAEAKRVGLRVIALTDHDTIGGIREALDAANDINSADEHLTVIPGVEISAEYKYPLHVLGYFNADGYERIGVFLDRMMYERNIRNIGIIQRLNNLGIKITTGEVAEIAGKEIYGRPHIAAALVKKDVVHSQAEAFAEYLTSGRKAYVGKKSRSPQECVAAIAKAGGLPVIAHPVKLGMTMREIKALAKSLISYGLYGIEAYYSDNTPKDTEKYVKLAADLGLQVTGGSDFHGDYRRYVRLGSGYDGNLRIPDSVTDMMFTALKSTP